MSMFNIDPLSEEDDYQVEEELASEELPFWKVKQVRQVGLALLVGLILTSLLIIFNATPPKVDVPRVAIPVATVSSTLSSAKTTVKGFGSVSSQKDISIRPQVNGTVVFRHESFQAGGRIQKGEVLFQIDPRDYEIAVEEQKALLERAQFELKLEEGNQVVAKREWKILKNQGSSSALSEELALRKPHLREKQASAKAAESRLKKAELDLERATVIAPFNSLVISEDVEIGKYVSNQELVANIVSTDSFDIEVQVLRSDLRWLPELFQRPLSREALHKIEVSVIQRLEDGQLFERKGRVIRLLGDVDQGGRMAKILIRVDAPLDVSEVGDVPLLLGTYVEVRIQGKTLNDLYQVPRKAVREGNVIWIVSPESTLDIVPVKEIFSDADYSYVRAELPSEIQVITSQLSSGLKGTLVSIKNE